jgi:acyl-CoA synthetase (AMP-forming)/AMP-acid ligase II
MRVTDRVLAAARTVADHPALVVGDSRTTYGMLASRIAAIAAQLPVSGDDAPSAAGSATGLLIGNQPVFLELFLAAAASGRCAAVFDPAWPAARLAQAVRDTAPAHLLFDPALAPRLVDIDPTVRAVAIPLADGAGCDATEPAAASDAGEASRAFLIGFTSGSSGAPKAYVRSHGSWVASLAAAAREFPLAREDRVLVAGPLAHSLFLHAALETLSAGATLELLPCFDASAVLARITSGSITRFYGVPTMYAALLDAANTADTRTTSLRAIISAGAKLAPPVRSALAALCPNAEIIEYYGASELSFVSIARSTEIPPAESVGRPFSGVAVSVRLPDGRIAAPGEYGTIHVNSDLCCDGYLKTYDGLGFRAGNGWATVGDQGYQDRDGWLYLTGREDDMLISGGSNVYPSEVEAVLRALPEVAEAVAIGLEDPYWGQRLCAVVRWREGRGLNDAGLRRACLAQLEPHKVPRQFYRATVLPQTSSGKIARHELRRRIAAGTLDRIR